VAARICASCRCSSAVRPSARALAMNRSSTAQHKLRQLVSPGNRPINFVRGQELLDGRLQGGARRFPRAHGIVLLGVVGRTDCGRLCRTTFPALPGRDLRGQTWDGPLFLIGSSLVLTVEGFGPGAASWTVRARRGTAGQETHDLATQPYLLEHEPGTRRKEEPWAHCLPLRWPSDLLGRGGLPGRWQPVHGTRARPTIHDRLQVECATRSAARAWASTSC